jgi:hypothetical protein
MLINMATDSHANIHNNTFDTNPTVNLNIAITVPNHRCMAFPDVLKICKCRN